jgi:hypothetical protein
VNRFSLESVALQPEANPRGLVVDVLLAGPTGSYLMGIRVINGDALDFTGERRIHFDDGHSRLTITPLAGDKANRDATLLLTIDGEELPPIALEPQQLEVH